MEDGSFRGRAYVRVNVCCADCCSSEVVLVGMVDLIRGIVPCPPGWRLGLRSDPEGWPLWSCPDCSVRMHLPT